MGRREIFSRIRSWYEKGVFSVILVSHNMDDIARLATRLLVMHEGRIILDGNPMDIFLHHRKELQDCGVADTNSFVSEGKGDSCSRGCQNGKRGGRKNGNHVGR